jgi:hypothetical protein
MGEIWNSHGLREIREIMLRGEEPKHCLGCYDTERRGFGSTRTNYNAMILNAPQERGVFTGFSRIDRASLKPTMELPTYFDLRFDNVCNLKCVMCFASESSSIESDPVQLSWTGEGEIARYPNRFDNPKKWVTSDLLFDELREIGANAEYIRLAGGEPFRSALALRWMDHLKRNGQAANITIQVYTNLQLFNERIIDLLSAFKYVTFVLSIDGTGQTYEYIRYPGKWGRIEENCARLARERKGRLARSEVSINATMSIPGAMRITDVFDFGERLGFGVNLSNAVDPAHVSTNYLPQASKERLDRTLRAYAAAHSPAFPYLPGQIDQWMEQIYSVRTSAVEHVEAFRDAMRFLNDMDKSRGLDFKKLQPELTAEFAAEAGTWIDGEKHVGAGDTGTVEDSNLNIASRAYVLLPHAGGSIEHIEETSRGYMVRGWVADLRQGNAAAAIAVAIGNDIQFTGRATTSRSDIADHFGRQVDPSGFEVQVFRRGNRPTSDDPVRLYALTNDGLAAPLACTAHESMPFANLPFILPNVARSVTPDPASGAPSQPTPAPVLAKTMRAVVRTWLERWARS